jgi:hypothetical protein
MVKVVHCMRSKYDIYIGRKNNSKFHYGNIASHKDDTLAAVRVQSREEAIKVFEEWLDGKAYQETEPERREWIWRQIPYIDENAVLGCWCSPKDCHGRIIKEKVEEYGRTKAL